jgi:hypothetical protein
MGSCQGRVCGGATDFLFGWKPDSVRLPISPTRLGSLLSLHGKSAAPDSDPAG